MTWSTITWLSNCFTIEVQRSVYKIISHIEWTDKVSFYVNNLVAGSMEVIQVLTKTTTYLFCSIMFLLPTTSVSESWRQINHVTSCLLIILPTLNYYTSFSTVLSSIRSTFHGQRFVKSKPNYFGLSTWYLIFGYEPKFLNLNDLYKFRKTLAIVLQVNLIVPNTKTNLGFGYCIVVWHHKAHTNSPKSTAVINRATRME